MPCSWCNNPNRDSVPTPLLTPDTMRPGARICSACATGVKLCDRAKRARYIQSGHILPLEMRPTLRLNPGERERFEREAVAWLARDLEYRHRLVEAPVKLGL